MIVPVEFWVMRHGEKDGDKLTPKGKEQVVASALKHLSSVSFDAAFYSGMNRAFETTNEVLYGIGSGLTKFNREEGFGYEWAQDDRWPFEPANKRVETLKTMGCRETVDLWLENWPPTRAIRGRFLATMLGWSRYFVHTFQKPHINVFVGSHSPTAELATLTPNGTPRLGEADIIHYTISVDNMETILTEDFVLSAPY